MSTSKPTIVSTSFIKIKIKKILLFIFYEYNC